MNIDIDTQHRNELHYLTMYSVASTRLPHELSQIVPPLLYVLRILRSARVRCW